LTELPEEAATLLTLKTLDLTGSTDITAVPTCMNNMPQLEQITLGNGTIQHFNCVAE
jgi:hypothetical protein